MDTGLVRATAPWTDYAVGDTCTNNNCDRRGASLSAATDLLVSDLKWMASQWADGGDAPAALIENTDAGLAAILTGMGSLSYGEVAGERMRLGVMLNDPEEAHSCFADNTDNDHDYDGLGLQNIYLGEYIRVEVQAQRDRVVEMSTQDRDALIAYLESL